METQNPQHVHQPDLEGWLHLPTLAPIATLAITHGAGSNCQAPLLAAVAAAFQAIGYAVLRYNLPFRQARPSGPPVGGKPGQARDRDGIRQGAKYLQALAPAVPLYLAGHSYGGRQSSMVAAEDATLTNGLLMLSYPLHPPGQPEKPRTEHFPQLRTPVLFVHGTKDEFGTPAELATARTLIPARSQLQIVDRAGHGLNPSIAASVADWFHAFTLGC